MVSLVEMLTVLRKRRRLGIFLLLLALVVFVILALPYEMFPIKFPKSVIARITIAIIFITLYFAAKRHLSAKRKLEKKHRKNA